MSDMENLKKKPFYNLDYKNNIIIIDFIQSIKVYKLNIDIDKNIFMIMNLFKDITDLNLQLYFQKKSFYLIASTKNIENANDKFKQLNKLEILEDIKLDDFKEFFSKILEIRIDTSFSDINKCFEKKIKCNSDKIKIDDNYFRLLKVREYPNTLNIKDLLEYSDISIDLKNKTKEETNKIYDNLLKNTEDEIEKYEEIFPNNLKKSLEKIKMVKDFNLCGFSMKILIKAKTIEEIEEKTNVIKNYTYKNNYITNIMRYNHKLKTFKRILPLGLNKNYTPVFFNEKEVRIFEIIKIKKKKSFFKKLFSNSPEAIIPITEIYDNGLIKLKNNYYTMIYKVTDINYELEKTEEKERIMRLYKEILASINIKVNFQIYIKSRQIDKQEMKNDIIITKETNYKKYLKEYNNYLEEKINETHSKTSNKSRYFVFSIFARSLEEANEFQKRNYFSIAKTAKKLEIDLKNLKEKEVINLLYEINNNSENIDFNFDTQLSIENKIFPESLKITKNQIEQGNMVKKIIYLDEFPAMCSDDFLAKLINFPFDLSVSVHIKTMNSKTALELIKKKTKGMEGNEEEYKKKYNWIPNNLERYLEEAKYFLEKLQEGQNLFKLGLYISIIAENKEELEKRVNRIDDLCSRFGFDISTFCQRQREGYLSTLPLAYDCINANRILLTDSTSIFIPFSSKNLYQKNGIPYGLNEVDDLLVIDRRKCKNPSAFFLGIPGSGKSFFAKLEMLYVFFSTNDDIRIIDPEREYTSLVELLGGTVVKVSVNSNTFINPMDISENYGDDEDPIKEKTTFLITFIKKLIGELKIEEKALLDRCISKIYIEYFKNKNEKEVPILKDLYLSLKDQNSNNEESKIANLLALKLEMYVEGSLNIFNNYTNVDVENRLVCYDLKNLGEELTPSAQALILDLIWIKISKNKEIKKHTWLYIDELHLLADTEASAYWMKRAWKRIRKFLGVISGITQNIVDILESGTMKTMISNSELIIMLDQATEDRKALKKLLDLSDEQERCIRKPDKGEGLISVSGSIMPFKNLFPDTNLLYQYLSTSE